MSGRRSTSAIRSAKPSSLWMACTSDPTRSRGCCAATSDHGACTRAPNGVGTPGAPVAELVVEPLDHDGAVIGSSAGGLGLGGEVVDELRAARSSETSARP